MKWPPWTRVLIEVGVVAVALLDTVVNGDAADHVLVYAISIGAALSLGLRRRYPLTVFALTLPGLLFGAALIPAMIALYTVAVTKSSRSALWGCSALVLFCDAVPWPPSGPPTVPNTRGALSFVYSCLAAGAPATLGLLVQARRELSDRLAELTERRDRERALVAGNILAQERAQLAREMHDVVSHQVSLIAVQAGALQVTAPNEATRLSAKTIRELSVKTLEELRHMVGVLRAAGAHSCELAPQPRLSDLQRMIDDSGIPARLELDGVLSRVWPEPVERAAYRTVQEALTNVRKHAHGAPVTVRMASEGNKLTVRVHNGPATTSAAAVAQLPNSGHGLIGLRERAESLGGTLTTGLTADGGFALVAVLPS